MEGSLQNKVERRLHIDVSCRGSYVINEDGYITQDTGNAKSVHFSNSWVFLGVSLHHWRKGIDVKVEEAFKDPSRLVKGIVWDIDHGTIRKWSGSCYGRLPRVTRAWVERIVPEWAREADQEILKAKEVLDDRTVKSKRKHKKS